jgi:hypothetical protein
MRVTQPLHAYFFPLQASQQAAYNDGQNDCAKIDAAPDRAGVRGNDKAVYMTTLGTAVFHRYLLNATLRIKWLEVARGM